MHTRLLSAVILSASLAACGPASVGGSIDGARVGGARDAIYDSLRLEFGPVEFATLLVMVTDIPDACETYEAFFDAVYEERGCDDLCEAYTDIAEERRLIADRYWATVLTINVSDGTDGAFDLDHDLDDEEFDASFYGYDTFPLHDPAECEDTCEDGDLLAPEIDAGEDGELELRKDDEIVRGRFDVGFGGSDRLRGTFAARPCDMGGWILP